MAEIKIEISVTDIEPITELIDIVTSVPLEELPEPLRTKLQTWYDKHYSGDDAS